MSDVNKLIGTQGRLLVREGWSKGLFLPLKTGHNLPEGVYNVTAVGLDNIALVYLGKQAMDSETFSALPTEQLAREPEAILTEEEHAQL